MKKFNLSKELLFNGMLIGALSIGLASCGGGSGSSSNAPQLSSSFTTYLYQGTDYQNEPIVTVYIDGQPVQLLADTGASGLVVNQSAVNIPSSDYTDYTFSNTFGDGSTVSGTMASATVCLNPNITNTCVVMPIGVNTSGNAFPSSFEAQGDFGLDSGLNIMDSGTNSSGSYLIGYSYPTYLAQEYGVNSYTIEFYPLSNTFYANVSPTTPIGQISFGIYAGNSNTLLSYAGGFPSATAIFPSYTSSKPSFTAGDSFFDTGSNFNFLTTDVFQTEIPNFSSSDENSCLGSGVLNGGFTIAYKITNYSTSFTTEPPANFCSSGVQWNLMIGNTKDAGSYSSVGYEDFGLPEMLRHTFIWVLNNQGLVQGISINP
ncbi:MAG: Retroviral aspartyl protease [Hydrogenobaculum sp.]